MRQLWTKFRLELIAGLLAIAGVFLLVEPFDIRASLRRLAAGFVHVMLAIVDRELASTDQFLSRHTTSDLIGMALIAGALIFIGWRTRYHFLHSDRFTKHACPRCGGPIVRVHRTSFDRLMGRVLFLPLFRFRCRNRACGWSGRRYGEHHRHRLPHSSARSSLYTLDEQESRHNGADREKVGADEQNPA